MRITMRFGALLLAVTLVASACSSGADPEPDIAAFCDALTEPLDLEPVAMLDIDPDAGAVRQHGPTATLTLARDFTTTEATQVAQKLGDAAILIESWVFLGERYDADDPGTLVGRFEALAADPRLATADDFARTVIIAGHTNTEAQFGAFTTDLRSLPGLAEVESSTDLPLASEVVFEAPETSLFELLMSGLLTPLLSVFFVPDATEADLSQIRRQLDGKGLRYWWFGQERAYQEYVNMFDTGAPTLDPRMMPPSFRVELATEAEAKTLSEWVEEEGWSSVFQIVATVGETIRARQAITMALAEQPDTMRAFDEMQSAATSDLIPHIEVLQDYLALAEDETMGPRDQAVAAASLLRDAIVASCGVDPCVCDRSTSLSLFISEVQESQWEYR